MSARQELELWAGVECTVNRVGDRWLDQVELTGHANRLDDLDRLASLGVRTLRYPILWERTAPHGLASIDFSWADERMARLRKLGIRPIVGLVHHGSGPAGTSLLDDSFVEGLAAFASRVAERYPWVTDFTPINEPLTTARFSGLYGHWYPHHRDDRSFARALVIETRATIAAMRAIRKCTPNARLVQTEDLGRTFSTRPLAYQADFENQRRWLSLDLLFGRVDGGHVLYDYLRHAGVTAYELDDIAYNACAPDLLGVNYYVTSDRHLDHRLAQYPSRSHGTNGRHRYADVEAVRVRREGIVGHERLLKETWKRYGAPLAITESHLGAAAEDQARWLACTWRDAQKALASGVDVRAVTLWSAFGAYDWDSLVTKSAGNYEPGAFDVRAPIPTPTVVAAIARELVEYGEPKHPLTDADGWWLRDERLLYERDSRTSSPFLVSRAS